MSKEAAPRNHDDFYSLIQRIGDGSDVAVWELVERYSKNILRLVRRRLPHEIQSKVDPSDVVQSVWKSLFRNGASLKDINSAEQFVAFLAGMARNKVFETHRRFTTYQATSIHREIRGTDAVAAHFAEGGDTPSTVLHARESWDRALQKVGMRGQEIVRLKLQGMNQDQIAERLGLSTRTVRRTLDSLLQSLMS